MELLRHVAMSLGRTIHSRAYHLALVLAIFSERNRGLSTTVPTHHYLWTYGPTAVLVILSAWWRQIDYRTRQLMPWVELIRGPNPVEKTLLLDYISPLEITTFILAIQNRHWLVVASQVGFNLVKVMIVASTALFSLQPVDIARNSTSLATLDTFSGYLLHDASALSQIDFQPVYNSYWISSLGMDFPAGTTEKYAYQTFKPTYGNTTNITGTVDTFSGDMGCEIGSLANVTLLENSTYVEVTSSGCGDIKVDTSRPTSKKGPLSYVGALESVNCSNRANEDDGGASFFVFMSLWEISTQDSNDTYPLYNLQSAVALVCYPTYAIRRATVMLDSAESLKPISVEIHQGEDSRLLPGFSRGQFAAAAEMAFGSAPDLAGNANATLADPHNLDAFTFLAMQQEPNLSLADMLRPDVLQRISGKTFGLVSAQLAHYNLVGRGRNDLTGSVTTSRLRLLLMPLSLKIMQALLIILIVLAISLFSLTPRHVVCRDPGSVGAIALMLATNPQVLRLLRDSGVYGLKDIKKLLSGHQFQSVATDRSFKIEAIPQTAEQPERHVPSSPQVKWWRPFVVTNMGKIVILIVPVLLIAALELLLRRSRSNQGLGDAPKDGYLRYTWAYIPAAAMVTVQTVFEFLDAAVKTMEPYRIMHAGPSPAEKSIFENPMNKSRVHALWDSVKLKQTPVFLTTLSMLVAPILIIAVSGLFTTNILPRSSAFGVLQTGWFNETIDTADQAASFSNDPNSHYNYVNSTGLMLAAMVTTTDTPYPHYKYENLAFPQLQTVGRMKNAASLANATTILSATLPAIRPRLNCAVIPKDKNLKLTVRKSQNPFARRLTIQLKTDACPMDSNNGYLLEQVDAPLRGSIGVILKQSLLNCDGFVHFFFGPISVNTNSITGLECSPVADNVPVEATVSLPDFRVLKTQVLDSTDAPTLPSLDKLPAVKLSSKMINYFIGMPWNKTSIQTQDQGVYDPFFQILVSGRTAPNPPAFNIEDITQIPRVIEAIDHLFGVIMAQIVVRLPIAEEAYPGPGSLSNGLALLFDGNLTYTGTLNYNGIRLEQSHISTRFLQVSLGIMFLCALAAYMQIDTRKLLTKNPTSIAAVASFLADSEFLAEKEGGGLGIPTGAEWMGVGELKKQGVFEGYMLSLGWWWKSQEDASMERWDARGFGIDVGQSMKV
ncbi:hypothetical protein K440DRAFT_661738 [Wilcoxina mikolae CBS 423.85]|nr:hypothetical protein K440DRAFT_661738 [Wilcoxina mikolae CBS 423.85]